MSGKIANLIGNKIKDMKPFSILPKIFTGLVLVFALPAFGQQTNQERIQGTWRFEKLELAKAYPDSAKVMNELKDVIFRFEKTTLFISGNEKISPGINKSGPYKLDGDKLIIGEDPAEILLLDDKQLRIRTLQGILYFNKT